MLQQLEDSILQILQDNHIDTLAWSGKAEELFLIPKKLPAVRYILENVDFKEQLSLNHYTVNARFSLLVFFRSLKEKGQGAYSLVENIINTLCTTLPFGFSLSLISIDLLYHQSSEFCYQIKFNANGKYLISIPEEELVRRITTYQDDEVISDVFSIGG